MRSLKSHSFAAELKVPEVELPANLNDSDMAFAGREPPKPRGFPSEMAFFFLFLEVVKLRAELNVLSAAFQLLTLDESSRAKRRELTRTALRRVEAVIWPCDTSRPLDWFLMLVAKAMLVS
jgi:hypothetical protein